MDKESLRSFVEERLEGTPYYLVDVLAEADDRYVVEIDSDEGVDIDFCSDLSRAVDAAFPRDEESDDYELEVGSAGLTAPFKVRRQYDKNIGQEIEVLTNDGKKLRGVLAAAGDDDFTLRAIVRERPEGSKRPVETVREQKIPYDSAKMVRVDLKF